MDERDCAGTSRAQRFSDCRQHDWDEGWACVGGDALDEHEVEGAQPGEVEAIGGRERRPLDVEKVPTDLVFHGLVDKPGVGLGTALVGRLEVGDQHATGPQGATAHVKQAVMLPQPQRVQQGKLCRADDVVLLQGAHKGAVLVVPCPVGADGATLPRGAWFCRVKRTSVSAAAGQAAPNALIWSSGRRPTQSRHAIHADGSGPVSSPGKSKHNYGSILAELAVIMCSDAKNPLH